MIDQEADVQSTVEDHRSTALGRWSLGWRVTVACLFIGMLGMLLLGLFGLGNPNTLNIFSTPVGRSFGVVPAPFFGVLAMMIGPWLQRFFPFTQGLLFGFAGILWVGLLATILQLIYNFWQPCPPIECSFVLSPVLAFFVFAGAPLAIMAGAGFGTAILVAKSRRARNVFIVLFVAVAMLFLVLPLLLSP